MSRDQNIVRDLAKQYMELATAPEQAEGYQHRVLEAAKPDSLGKHGK